jgi:hypothetical protein
MLNVFWELLQTFIVRIPQPPPVIARTWKARIIYLVAIKDSHRYPVKCIG